MEDLVTELRVAYLLVDDGDRRTLAGADLTQTQFNLLRAVRDHEEDPSVSALAAELLCTRGNITRLVSRMVAADLVRTVGDPSDQRLVRVRLTELGAERLQRAEVLVAEANDRRLASLSEAEMTQLRGSIAHLIAALRTDLDAR